MRRIVLAVCGVVVIGLLLAGCGGGGGGGVTPPSTTDVARLYPLTQGRTWTMDYNETSHDYIKMTGEIAGLSVKRSRIGPFTIVVPLPKFSPVVKSKATHTIERTADETKTGTDEYTITGTMTSSFPREVSIQEDHVNGQESQAYVVKVDGVIVDQDSYSGDLVEKTRNFYTNENGEFKWWGTQEYDSGTGTWGDIEVFPEPWLMFKAGVTSWTVGHIEGNIYENLSFSADIVAQLVGKETVTVPAGTFQCYKVVYTLKDAKITPPSEVKVTSWKLDMTMTVWVALDRGMVKSEEKFAFNASYMNTETGEIGSVSHSSESTLELH